MANDRIFVTCTHCDGSGRNLERESCYDRDSGYFEDYRDLGPCEHCAGTGSEEVAGEPITLEDLEGFP